MRPTIISNIFNAVIITILIGSSLILRSMAPLYKAQFFEQDLSLSYTNYNSQVSAHDNIIFSCGIPISIIIFSLIIPQYNAIKHLKDDNILLRIFLIFHFGLYLGYTLLVTSIITNIIKCITSSLRPDFYDQCNYQYFSTNYTLYLNLTSYGAQGNINLCSASYDNIIDSQKSFPSGHASLSFASMMFTSLLINFYFDDKKIIKFGSEILFIDKKKYINDFNMCKLLCFIPFIFSTWISITRVQDNKHHIQDVITGALIGSIVCYLIFTKLKNKIYCELSKIFYEQEIHNNNNLHSSSSSFNV